MIQRKPFIAFIAFFGLAAGMITFQGAPFAGGASAKNHAFRVSGIRCTQDKIQVDVVNLGDSMPMAEGFVETRNAAGRVMEAGRGSFLPSDVGAGQTARLTVYLDLGGGHSQCMLTGIRNIYGDEAAITNGMR